MALILHRQRHVVTDGPPLPRPSGRAALPSGRAALRFLARAGLVARGMVYGVVGLLALKLALGVGGRTTSQSGAMHTIARQAFGEVLLIALAIGLAGYALWRLTEAATGRVTAGKNSLMHRLSALASAVAYGGLCFTAVEILTGRRSSSGSPRPAAKGVLDWSGGPTLVAIAGVVIVAVGAYQGYKGLRRKFLEESDTQRMSDAGRRAFTALGVTGHLARAVTFALIGYGLIKAAADYTPKAAIGLDGALQKLAHASDGPLLLGIVAGGFIAFAFYSIADSRYHRT